MDNPTLFDELEPEPTPAPAPAAPIDYQAALRDAAAAYKRERPELCRPRVFLGKQETSRKAAERALPKSGTKRHAIWSLIKGRDGLTADQINAMTGISPNTINPTIRGLVLDGWVGDSGRREMTRSGNEAIVWVAIP